MSRQDDLYKIDDLIRIRDFVCNRDMKVRCYICDEEIPSDGYYYRIGSEAYCQDCMDKYYRVDVDY